MEHPSVRPADEIETVVRTHGDMLFRICLVMLGSESDAEDAVQDTLLRFMQKAPVFDSPEHEKAWLIRVAANRCKDMLRFRRRFAQAELTDLEAYIPEPESRGIVEALMSLPEKFRVVLALYYVEEVPIRDIARIIGRTESAVKMRLQKGRRLLEDIYRKEYL